MTIYHESQTPRQAAWTPERREKMRLLLIERNKSPEFRQFNSERIKSNPIPGGGRKKGGKNSKPLPRESYLHLKPPRPTAESSAKSAATRKGMKLTAEHRLNMSIARRITRLEI